MADRYVDTTLSGTTVVYDPVTRSLTGGSDFGYATARTAIAALENDDNLIFRGGSETDASGQIVATESGVTISVYESESYEITFSDDTDNGFTITGANTTFELGAGTFKIIGAPTLNKRAITFTQAGERVKATTGRMILDWSGTPSSAGEAFRVGAAVAVEASNIVFEGDPYRVFSGSNGYTLTLNNPIFLDGCSVERSNTTGTVVLNSPLIISPDRDYIEIDSGTMTITVNNPLFIGAYAQSQFDASGQTINVNGGIANLVSIDAGVANVATVNLSTAPAVINDAVVKFAKNQNVKAYVSIGFVDSAQAVDAIMPDYLAAAATYNAPLTLYTDDANSLSAEKIANINTWLAAGHDLASSGISGSDDWDTTNPCTLTYNDAGAFGNIKLVISDNGETWEVQKVSDSSNVAGPYDCSLAGDYPKLGLNQAINNAVDPTAILRQLEIDVTAVAGITSLVVTDNGGGAGFDDAAAWAIEDATYTLLDGVGNTDLEFNMDRRLEFELDYAKAQLLSEFNFNVVSFFATGTSGVTELSTHASNNGWTNVINGLIAYDNDSNKSPFEYQAPQLAALWDDIAPTSRAEAEIRAGVRRLLSIAFAKGVYLPLILPASTDPFDEAEVGYVIDELQQQGATIIKASDAPALISENIVPSGYNYTPITGSDAIGAGYKYWTGVNPEGANGEPFSDFDTDAGPIQSVLSPLHPVNL